MRVRQLIEDDLNKRSAKHANKFTLVTKGAVRNVDLWNPNQLMQFPGKKYVEYNIITLNRSVTAHSATRLKLLTLM